VLRGSRRRRVHLGRVIVGEEYDPHAISISFLAA
jgi:hypothetical protein